MHERRGDQPGGSSEGYLPPQAGAVASYGTTRTLATSLLECDRGKVETLKVGALEAEIGDLLAPVRDLPYIVFHDAYQYFEKTFRLNAKGALAVDPSRPPGARRLRELKQRIAAEQIGCVFREPDFKPATLAAVIEGTGAQIAELDPMGQVSGNLQAYASLIRNLARNLKSCLAP